MPISVSMPVPVTTYLPRPYTTELPIYAMFLRSPRGTSEPSRPRASSLFVTGTLSPVSAASSILRLALSRMRPSAGTASPASSTMTSPGTTSDEWMICWRPPRSTLHVAAVISRSASMAFSALLS